MKFSIRDLLLVTVIVALAVGWWVDRWRQVNRSNSLIEAGQATETGFGMLRRFIEQEGYEVDWEPAGNGGRLNVKHPGDTNMPNSSAPAPKLPSD